MKVVEGVAVYENRGRQVVCKRNSVCDCVAVVFRENGRISHQTLGRGVLEMEFNPGVEILEIADAGYLETVKPHPTAPGKLWFCMKPVDAATKRLWQQTFGGAPASAVA